VQSLTALMQWLQSLPLATLIHQTKWLFTTIEVIHVAAVATLIGSIAMVDLRLLGVASTKRPFTEVARPILRWTWAAFVLAAMTGSLLFISQAAEYFVSNTFRIKVVIMALAGINMLIFELITARGVGDWNHNPTPPLSARVAGGISLGSWILVFVLGRLTGFSILAD